MKALTQRMRLVAWVFWLAQLPGCYLWHSPLEADAAVEVDAAQDASLDASRTPDAVFDATSDGGCVGEACEVLAELDGLRWELPCQGETDWPEVCATEQRLRKRTRLRGAPGARYDVRLRFRGVVETKSYAGGTEAPPLNRSGEPDDTFWNIYALRVSSPASRLFLNAGEAEPFYCIAIDIETTVTMAAGATVTLEADVFDARQIRNHDTNRIPIVIDGIAPAPLPYDGQFIQMDVLAVTTH